MNISQGNKFLTNKENQINILKSLNININKYKIFFDKKTDSLTYITYGEQTKLLQIIFLSKEVDAEFNFFVLERANNLFVDNEKIDEVTQFNIITYHNIKNFEMKSWSFKDSKNVLYDNLYNVFVLNIEYIKKKKNSIYKEFYETIKPLFL